MLLLLLLRYLSSKIHIVTQQVITNVAVMIMVTVVQLAIGRTLAHFITIVKVLRITFTLMVTIQ